MVTTPSQKIPGDLIQNRMEKEKADQVDES